MVVLVTATAMSVDIGREVAENRDLQRSADALAMDTVRVVDGTSTDSQISTLTNKAFADSAARNNISTTIGAPTYATYVLGTWNPATQTFTSDVNCGCADPTKVVPNAVQVTAFNSFTNTFGNLVSSGGQTLQRSAVASHIETASMSLDTTTLAASVSGPAILNKVLDGYLGNGNLSITSVGYQGLASTSLTLGQLATAGNYASPSQLLSANLTIPQWANLAVEALDQNGQSSSAAATALAAVAASSTTTGTFEMGSVIGTASGSTGTGTAAGYNVNLLAMLLGGGQIANGSNFLNNNFGVSVPITDPSTGASLGSATVNTLQFSAINGKGEWFGLPACSTPPCPFTESTSQVTLQALGMQFTIEGVAFNLSVSLSVAQASGYVQDINCAKHIQFDGNRDQVWWNALNGTLNGGSVTLLTGPVTLASNTSLGVVVSGPGGGSQQTNWFQWTNGNPPTWNPPDQPYSAGSFTLGSGVQQAVYNQVPLLSTLLDATGRTHLQNFVDEVVKAVTPSINLSYGDVNVGAPNPPQCGNGNLLVK